MAYSGEGSLIEGQIEGDPNKTVIPVAVDSNGHLIVEIEMESVTIGTVNQGLATTPAAGWPVMAVNTLIPMRFDYVSLLPTGTNPTTIEYKLGGSGGTLVATLALTYDGNNNVQTVTRT